MSTAKTCSGNCQCKNSEHGDIPELSFREEQPSTKSECLGGYCLSHAEYRAWRRGELPNMVIAGDGWELALIDHVGLRQCFRQLEGVFLRLMVHELDYFEE